MLMCQKVVNKSLQIVCQVINSGPADSLDETDGWSVETQFGKLFIMCAIYSLYCIRLCRVIVIKLIH